MICHWRLLHYGDAQMALMYRQLYCFQSSKINQLPKIVQYRDSLSILNNADKTNPNTLVTCYGINSEISKRKVMQISK